METIRAEDNGNESILLLTREHYAVHEAEVAVEQLNPSYEQHLMALHDSIFPNVYVSGKAIIQSIGKNRQVFTIVRNGELCGYSVLKMPAAGTRATAEVIAVDEKHRQQGYGKALLDAIVQSAFSNDAIESIDLVVENVNHHAKHLYHSTGFELLVENRSFMLGGKGQQPT